jgi:hypothetical protein
MAAAMDGARRNEAATEMGPPTAPRTTPPDGGDEKAQRERLARQVARGLASVHFDSALWMAQFPGPTPAARAQGAQRLLLATAPQSPPDLAADSLTVVRALFLDAAYQVK